MKFKFKFSLPALLGVIGFASISAPVQAQWTVTDPGAYAYYGTIWSSNVLAAFIQSGSAQGDGDFGSPQ